MRPVELPQVPDTLIASLACDSEWRHYAVVALRAAVEALGLYSAPRSYAVWQGSFAALRPPLYGSLVISDLSVFYFHNFHYGFDTFLAWLTMRPSLYLLQHSSDVEDEHMSP